jgi:phosphatidylserine synthase
MKEPEMFEKLRSYVPNYITFLSLAGGVTAILFSFKENLYLAGILILGSAFLDGLDCFSARKLKLQSTL